MDELIGAFLIGDYRQALAALATLKKSGDLERLKAAIEANNPVVDQAGAIAELYFYMGQNKEARVFVARYVRTWQESPGNFDIVLGKATIRTRLQVAESFYSQEKYEAAEAIAQAAHDRAEDAKDYRGMAEASYYLMRIKRRLYRHVDVTHHQHRAIEAFSLAALQSTVDRVALPWRVGLVHLVAGFTLWRAGDLESAMTLLQTAGCLLLEKTGDFIGRANVRHTIGVIQRSRGLSSEALKHLSEARSLYAKAGHQLNLMRVLTDIGRAYLDSAEWQLADHWLREAEGICQQHDAPRHQAEISLWRAWLAQAAGVGYGSREQEMAWAEQASKSTALAVSVEGHIVFGYSLANAGFFAQAEQEFVAALTTADETEMAKHRANALLSLAEFYSMYPVVNLQKADRYYDDANRILPVGTSAFLLSKADRVRRQMAERISRNRGELLFIRSVDDILRDGFKSTKAAFERWSLESVLMRRDQKGAAEILAMEPESLRKRVSRMRAGERSRRTKKRPQ